MHKDVIYIDTEDDITAIIGKVKNSKEKIVALVPPKRVGVLQSAVNLKLLARMSEANNKRLVIVTNNKALVGLSAVAKIPIAKNLQSRPEMPELDELEVDEEEDIIEGKKLPIGEIIKANSAEKTEEEKVESVIDSIDIEKDDSVVDEVPTLDKVHKKEKNEVKIPNFAKFRIKLFVGVLILIGLSGFLFWAIKYAPYAKIIVTAKVSPESVSRVVKLGGTASTNVAEGIIQTVSKQINKDVTVNFVATGEKNVGSKATGIVTIENCDSNVSFTIAAETIFESSSGKRFTNSSAVIVPGFTGSASACRLTGAGAGTVDVSVIAVDAGESYNISSSGYEIDGVVGDIYSRGSAMTGGTTKMATVVTAEDVEKAAQDLIALSTDSVKQQLSKQFTDGEFVLNDSFNVVHGVPVSSPAVGEEVTDKSTLTSSTVFSITAIAKKDIEMYLNDELDKKITDKNQKVYNNGVDKVKISEYLSTDNGTTVKISTDAVQIGPDIDKDMIAGRVKGMRYGDAQALIGSIQGVDSVDIKFSYFWVRTIPKDLEKIDVEFTLQDA